MLTQEDAGSTSGSDGTRSQMVREGLTDTKVGQSVLMQATLVFQRAAKSQFDLVAERFSGNLQRQIQPAWQEQRGTPDRSDCRADFSQPHHPAPLSQTGSRFAREVPAVAGDGQSKVTTADRLAFDRSHRAPPETSVVRATRNATDRTSSGAVSKLVPGRSFRHPGADLGRPAAEFTSTLPHAFHGPCPSGSQHS